MDIGRSGSIFELRRLGWRSCCWTDQAILRFFVVAIIYQIALLIHGLLMIHDGYSASGVWNPLIVAGHHGHFVLAAYVFHLTVLGPVSEEFYSRGRLWVALRRSWGVWPTALCTAAIWWLAHWGLGLRGLFQILPDTIIITLVRLESESIRATIPVHILINLRIVLITLLSVS